jgi:Protein kinase C terminal domain
LGAGETDAEEVKMHPYFQGIDWLRLLSKELPPPEVPIIDGALDISNFDEEFTRQDPNLTPTRASMNPQTEMELKDFCFIADWAYQERIAACLAGEK